MQVLSLGWEDPLEEEMAICSSILAWKNSWTEEPGTVHGDLNESDMVEHTHISLLGTLLHSHSFSFFFFFSCLY